MCVDIEKYFRRSSKEKDRDARFFRDRLTEVVQVLVTYIQVQDNREYYTESDVHLERGKSALLDFREYVLESIRRGNDADLLDYKVSTKILQAQRFR